jgi:O-antigen ligase
VGWQMFLDSPLIGVGSGNYQHALIVSYRYLIPAWAEVTLSHTSIISIIAENGIIGLAVFLFACVRVAAVSAHAYFGTKSRYSRLMVGWLGAGLLGIVFHSQSEGRLFDEPYIYLLLAMLVAFETAPALRGLAAAAPEAEAAAARPAQARSSPRRAPLREAPVAPITDGG